MADVAVRGTLGGRSLFGDVLGFDPFRAFPATTGYGFEISRAENGYRIELPVPGFRPEQIDVTIEDRVLTIVGKSERRNFTRTVVIPEEIDAENIGANVEHGMLTLELHVHPKAQPRKIAVTGSAATQNSAN
jgi:HSP20 family molecular chaperone IbpA